MHRQSVGAIFQRIILGDGRAGQFAVLADQQQPRAEPDRQRPADGKTPRLDRRDQINRLIDCRAQRVDRRGQAGAVEQQSRDVAKLDSRLGEVRNSADQRLQFVGAGHDPVLSR